MGYHCHFDTGPPSCSDRRQVASHPPIENCLYPSRARSWALTGEQLYPMTLSKALGPGKTHDPIVAVTEAVTGTKRRFECRRSGRTRAVSEGSVKDRNSGVQGYSQDILQAREVLKNTSIASRERTDEERPGLTRACLRGPTRRGDSSGVWKRRKVSVTAVRYYSHVIELSPPSAMTPLRGSNGRSSRGR